MLLVHSTGEATARHPVKMHINRSSCEVSQKNGEVPALNQLSTMPSRRMGE
jgi:hypothetical protein